jgi:nucleotide-binding universal stress UspA family protein
LPAGGYHSLNAMFERILFPLDFSEQSMQMFDCLLELKHMGTKVIILCYVQGANEVMSLEQRRKMDDLKKRLEEQGIEAVEVVEQGDPVQQILRIAEREQVTLIAMASSGKGKAREFLIGSTSFGILRSSSWLVLINRFQVTDRSGQKEVAPVCRSIFRKALVPIDFSSCTPASMDLVPRLSKLGLQEAVLFHVVENSKANMDDEEHFKTVVDKVLSDLEGLKGQLVEQGCNASTHVHFGTVSYNILEAARELEVSLIILGAHRKSLLREIALGGNSEPVVRKSTVPLLVIPCER